MTPLFLHSGDRLLVLAPHPDDETLACGGVIRRALGEGAHVCVVIATNGDANPWPQRLAERRWRLGPDAAARWGARRMAEAREALRILGADGDHVHFLGWRDQGITARMEHEPTASVEALQRLLRAVRPTLVVAPSLFDSHPDHSALALLLHAALRTQPRTRVLAYWLHGRPPREEGPVSLPLSPAEQQCKRRAVLAHRTQLHFGHGRMLEYVQAQERFYEEQLPAASQRTSWTWDFAVRGRAPMHRLRIVGVTAGGKLQAATYDLRDPGRPAGLAWCRKSSGVLQVSMAPSWPEPAWVVAKLDHRHRVYVYDTGAWHEPAHPDAPGPGPRHARNAVLAGGGKGHERRAVHAGNPNSSPESDMRPWKILCDFDGTVCLPDATDEVLARCADPGWMLFERQWRDGLIGSRECMSRQVGLIDATEQQVDAVIDGIRIDPAFPRFVALARALGVELAIVSDGLDYAIHRILRRHGLDDLPLVANRFERVSERHWRLSSPHADAGCSANSGTCKCAWAARARDTAGGARILLIGDGQSDTCVAARADFVFAMSKLLAHCRANGIGHRSIRGFEDAIALLPDLIAGRLDADGVSATRSPLEFA